MIDINIRSRNGEVLDSMRTNKCTLEDVALALWKLKQIERILIDPEVMNNLEKEK